MLDAVYYDGQSSNRQPVTLSIEEGGLRLQGEAIDRVEPLAAVHIPTRLGQLPRQLRFADGAHCEVADHDGFETLFGPLVGASGLAHRLESHWQIALAALAVTLISLAAAYFWGLPWLAQRAAERVPPTVLASLDEQALKTLDGDFLQPSALIAARRQALNSRFLHLKSPPDAIAPRQLLFRKSPLLGANAFALPGGTVVVLDDLVQLADNDEEILAVIAHEMGHVTERHALRQWLQASVVALLMTWYIGDVSSLLATVPSALLQTRYSREFERRADGFAASMLALNAIPTTRLADMLQRLEGAAPTAERECPPEQENDSPPADVEAYLSTHPGTRERIRLLREMDRPPP